MPMPISPGGRPAVPNSVQRNLSRMPPRNTPPPRNGGIPGYTPGMTRPPINPGGIGRLPGKYPGGVGGFPGKYPGNGGPVTNPLVPRRNPQLTPDLLRAMAARRLGG